MARPINWTKPVTCFYAGIKTDGMVDESNWSHVELSAIEEELDVEKLRSTLEEKLGTFKIMA